MPDNELVRYQTDHGEVVLSADIIRNYLVSGDGRVSDQEVMLFLRLCQYQRLNPFLREAYLIKYGDRQPASMVVGKDTFMKRAMKNERFRGYQAGVYVSRGSTIEKRVGALVAPGERLVGGWASVRVEGYAEPVEVSVSLEEYIGRKSDGSVTRQWIKMPATMIRKVAIVQALREAFPADFQGLYDESEMGTEIPPEAREKPVVAEVREVQPEPKPEPEPEPESKPQDVPSNDRKQYIAMLANEINAGRQYLSEERIKEIKDALKHTKTEDLPELIQSVKDEIAVLAVQAEGIAEPATVQEAKPAVQEKPPELNVPADIF